MSDPIDAIPFEGMVRLHVYGHLLEHRAAPTVGETATAVGAAPAAVEGAYRRLAEGRAIVLRPGTLQVWMANPLSAVPTAFRVEVGARWWWANCIWDGLGVLAMLGEDGLVRTACPDCGHPLSVSVRGGNVAGRGVGHFAVPARHWWDDIGHT